MSLNSSLSSTIITDEKHETHQAQFVDFRYDLDGLELCSYVAQCLIVAVIGIPKDTFSAILMDPFEHKYGFHLD